VVKQKSNLTNLGFEKLKNPLLRDKLLNGERVLFSPKTHVRVKDLKYKSIYDLDSLSKKKWNDYFSKGKVYIDKDVTLSKISQRILFDKSIIEFFGKTDNQKWRKPFLVPRTKRGYIVGGRGGKVKGFNFYFYEDKLKPYQRRILLSKSEKHIDSITTSIDISTEGLMKSNIEYLDSSLTDSELMDTWNRLYDEYGYLMSDFRDKWERERFGIIKDFGDKKDETKSYNPLKLDSIERRRNKIYDLG